MLLTVLAVPPRPAQQLLLQLQIVYVQVVSMRQFCLGLLLVDSTPAPHGGHRGMQWLRCRLEMLFRFYDLNADGKLDRDEFVHFVRHMLRLAGQPHDLDTAKATAKQIAKALPVARREALSEEDFIAVVSSGELHKYQLHTSGLLQLPPFRQPALARTRSQTRLASPRAASLHDVQIRDLMSACGYTSSDLALWQAKFLQYADTPGATLDASKRCSPKAFVQLLRALGTHMPTPKYEQQYVRAFDFDGNGEVENVLFFF